MEIKDSIKQAKNGFDHYLHSQQYKKIHSDSEHLQNLLALVPVQKNKRYLDLGTGNGYIAGTLAGMDTDITVHGLDIANTSIIENNRQNTLKNLSYETYDGIDYPYPDSFFYAIISRYAFHHFPDVKKSMAEINRVTENSGFFIFSDPRTDDIDKSGFIDDFQKLIPDGHNHFYRENEIVALFARHNFKKEKLFYSTIRYPRDYNKDYETLFKKPDNKILDNYKVNREKRKVFITVTVLNILFKKIKEIYKSGNISRH